MNNMPIGTCATGYLIKAGGGESTSSTWKGLTFEDCPDEKFPNKDFREGALWAENILREKNK